MMRICSCGGKIDSSEMTSGVERWKCNSCGRYELFEKPKESMRHEIISNILGSNIQQDIEELEITGTEARVCLMIAQRQKMGIKKYGTTVEGNPLSLRQWLQHQLEELLDAAVYCQRAIEEVDQREDDLK